MYLSLLSLGMSMGYAFDDITTGQWVTDGLLKSNVSSMIPLPTFKSQGF